jgi:excisionase family DNA binding protein
MSEKISEIDQSTDIMTVRDVALYLRLSEAMVYKLAREGHVPALRVGRSWRFRKNLIDDWIRRETEAGQRVVVWDQ